MKSVASNLKSVMSGVTNIKNNKVAYKMVNLERDRIQKRLARYKKEERLATPEPPPEETQSQEVHMPAANRVNLMNKNLQLHHIMNSPAKREIFLQESTNEDVDNAVGSMFEKQKKIKLVSTQQPRRHSEVTTINGDLEDFVLKPKKPIPEISSDSSSYESSSEGSVAERAEKEMSKRDSSFIDPTHARIPKSLQKQPTYDPLKLITSEMRQKKM